MIIEDTSANNNNEPVSLIIDSEYDDTHLTVILYRQDNSCDARYPNFIRSDNFGEFSSSKVKGVEEPLDVFLSLF